MPHAHATRPRNGVETRAGVKSRHGAGRPLQNSPSPGDVTRGRSPWCRHRNLERIAFHLRLDEHLFDHAVAHDHRIAPETFAEALPCRRAYPAPRTSVDVKRSRSE